MSVRRDPIESRDALAEREKLVGFWRRYFGAELGYHEPLSARLYRGGMHWHLLMPGTRAHLQAAVVEQGA